MIWAEIYEAGKKTLKEAGIGEYELDAWYLFEAVFGISRANYFLCAREEVKDGIENGGQSGHSAKKIAEYDALLKRRAARIPLQQILHSQDFMGLPFYVNEHVLIPRQDTETLVETVLREQKDRNQRILDLCTGSGCIAISLKKLGGFARVEGADISAEALWVAKKNAGDLETEVIFRTSDMFSAFGPEEKFNIIVSNPPYIATEVIKELEPEVRDHEPFGALDGKEDGLYFYRILAKECKKHLLPGGSVYFEIGYDQGEAVSELLSAGDFIKIRVIQDLAGKDRVVCGCLPETDN